MMHAYAEKLFGREASTRRDVTLAALGALGWWALLIPIGMAAGASMRCVLPIGVLILVPALYVSRRVAVGYWQNAVKDDERMTQTLVGILARVGEAMGQVPEVAPELLPGPLRAAGISWLRYLGRERFLLTTGTSAVLGLDVLYSLLDRTAVGPVLLAFGAILTPWAVAYILRTTTTTQRFLAGAGERFAEYEECLSEAQALLEHVRGNAIAL